MKAHHEAQAREVPPQQRTVTQTVQPRTTVTETTEPNPLEKTITRWTNTKSDTTTDTSNNAVDKTVTQTADPWAMQSDEGIVRSVDSDLIVVERDNGSQVRIKASGASVTMPTVGQRVYVQYRLDGMERVATKIEQR
jgi:hypothetical protein